MTKRSKASLERRMAANKSAHRFDQVAYARTPNGLPDRLRYSRIAGLLPPEARAVFDAERLKAARCPEHGLLDDPAVFTIGECGGERVAFACPWCSGSAVLAQWEREGAS